VCKTLKKKKKACKTSVIACKIANNGREGDEGGLRGKRERVRKSASPQSVAVIKARV
jgi:hypothetical protein